MSALGILVIIAVVALAIVLMALRSFHSIGPAEVGLVAKRVGGNQKDEQLVALKNEAGYQADLLMPGLRFKLWPIYKVERYPWVQVPPDQIGVVIAQVGAALPTGAKSAIYRPEFGSFADLRTFLSDGGQRGVQRPVLPPGTTAPIHPVGFVVITGAEVYGKVVSDTTLSAVDQVDPGALRVTHITPQGETDLVGVVTTLEGPPSGDIASRIGGFSDVTTMEHTGARIGQPDHPGRAQGQEHAARQLPGLPGLPRQRRLHRAPARPAALRLVPAQSRSS